MTDYVIEDMRAGDWRAVKSIYAEGLATGLAAFTTKPPLWRDWDAGQLQLGRLVARDRTGAVVAWAALKPVPDT